MAQERDIWASLLRQLHQRDGAWPSDFTAAVELGAARFPPWNPFGLTLEYHPESGVLAWSPPWPEIERGKHGEVRL
jgi:hypothetical protein